jgi:crotonobetainyl-CoA:carnitine CoA-transferase CaiB-like acyl-CoA transferase
MNQNSPLKGIRIIDLCMGWAGPLAARNLADMGADVIKVESCENFDWWRSWEATPEWIEEDGAEKSAAFNTTNRNNRNITLDLSHPEGRDLLLKLVGTANAVMENYSGSVLPKLKLGYEIFKEVKEDVILLSMPAFGSTGPWKMFRAYGSTVEQSSGLPHINGISSDPPMMHHVAYGDPVGGLNGVSALLVALRHQAKTGEGQFIDLSQAESLFPLGAHGILEFTANSTPPLRSGNRSSLFAPHGVYPCVGEDKWIVIQILEEGQWLKFQEIVGAPIKKFGDLKDRLSKLDELDKTISVWTSSQEAQKLMYVLQEARIPAASTQNVSSLLNDPHLNSRNFWQWLDRAIVGNQPNPSAPFYVNEKRLKIKTPAPTLGQHNEEVLTDILGLKQNDLDRLKDIGIIGTKPRMKIIKK